MKKLLIIVIEGCSIEYISREMTPNMYRIAREGFCKCVKATFPTVGNVNHATILTGKFPNEYKVTTKTVIDHLHDKGCCTAMLSVKSDVLENHGRNVDFNMCVEDPKDILVRFLEMPAPPPVNSLNAAAWILEACYQLLKRKNNDVVYCTTNDYMMHHFGPDSGEAIELMRKIDDWIGKIYDLDHEREIYITGAYGINKKSHLIDLQAVLDNNGFEVICQPSYREEFSENHIYHENGVQFIHLNNQNEKMTGEMLRFLEAAPFIDSVYPKEEAAKRYYLPKDMIGDYVIFPAEEYAFAELKAGQELEVQDLRSHGSIYECAVPLIAVNAREAAEKYRYSRDIVKNIMEQSV